MKEKLILSLESMIDLLELQIVRLKAKYEKDVLAALEEKNNDIYLSIATDRYIRGYDCLFIQIEKYARQLTDLKKSEDF
jgi:hypothetical protein